MFVIIRHLSGLDAKNDTENGRVKKSCWSN